jgi:enamine deaminase RidA (YjgF/YER057c/UK114 family)
MIKIEEKIKGLGITIPEVKKTIAEYIPAVTVGNLVFTSGVISRIDGMKEFSGKVGGKLTLEEGKEAAKQCAINILAILKHELGDLDRVERIVRLEGFVNSADGFKEQPFVINGASELFVKIWGDKGRHARAALSTNELYNDEPVEIYCVVQIKEG